MRLLLTFILSAISIAINAQTFESKVSAWAKAYTRPDCTLRPSTLKSCYVDAESEKVTLELGGGFPEQFFTPEVVDSLYGKVRSFLPEEQNDYKLEIIAEGHPIEFLVPNFFRKNKKDEARLLKEKYRGESWVKNMSRPYSAHKGLEGNHIALWQSHGRYLRDKDNDWWWQRPRMFCTTEDLFSQTFVVPYIIPMLQNAGAVVFTPRERDWQCNEVIVDNDQPNQDGMYIESVKKKQNHLIWQSTEKPGFAHIKDTYESCDSPFCDGTARLIPTVQNAKDEAVVQWIPNVPAEGKYAVYVAYQSFENSVEDATYTVFHKGGMTEFRVNQKIGGGMWVYLGTFEFDKGEHDYGMVALTNRSNQQGIITADAIRLGGGMGNVVPPAYTTENGDTITASPSGLPRWAEAAKYSTVWYGFPYSIHTEPFGRNDYNNDINSRSASVNYLMGNSIYHPTREDGLGVPLDLTVAFHTDAGFSREDDYVGSLSIYKTDFNEGLTGAGLDRYVSRDIASILLTNLSVDLKKYGWNVRQLWNRDYGEARVPMTPVCILEMLSHQNFADMKLAYNPVFKFDFCRSVYKSMVKFIATQYDREYTIQPLPVKDFHIELNENKHTATLSWKAQNDPLEPTAKPHSYILYQRRGHQGFDNGIVVKGTSCTVNLLPDEVYSFKITALNDGGESFPSEVLSAGISSKNKGTVLIVNAFTRLEGPAEVNTSTEAGFNLEADPGVPYGAFAGYCGNQKGFARSRAGSEASDGLGASGNEYEGNVMMGNTFDYAVIHGRGIMESGTHSFTSCSEESLANGEVDINHFPIVDMIYGVQKQFDACTNDIIAKFANKGGKVIISSANEGCADIGGNVYAKLVDKSMTGISGCGLDFNIYRDMNPQSYSVPAPSVLSPLSPAFPILTYSDGSCAGIAQQGRFIRLGFPLESIDNSRKINLLMKAFLQFLE